MKILTLVAIASIADALPAQGPPPGPAATIAGRGAFWAVSVADLSATTRWYSEKFGLHVVMETPKANNPAAVVLEGNGLIVELIRHTGAKPRAVVAPGITEPVLIHGLMKAGLVVDDFDATVALLRSRNIPIAFGPFPARPGQRANVIVRDIEGNLIQFFGR